MTIDEHMSLRWYIMNARDELSELARCDPHLRHYVEELEECLAILNRPHIRCLAGEGRRGAISGPVAGAGALRT